MHPTADCIRRTSPCPGSAPQRPVPSTCPLCIWAALPVSGSTSCPQCLGFEETPSGDREGCSRDLTPLLPPERAPRSGEAPLLLQGCTPRQGENPPLPTARSAKREMPSQGALQSFVVWKLHYSTVEPRGGTRWSHVWRSVSPAAG